MHRKQDIAGKFGWLGFGPMTTLGLVAALSFFVLSGAISIYVTARLQGSNDRVVQTHQTIVAVDQLLLDVQNAETGHRGFLLTGDEQYLAPYLAAVGRLASRLSQARELVVDDGAQRAQFDELEITIQDKFDIMEQSITTYRNAGQAAAIAEMNADEGIAVMDTIRSLIADLRSAETDVRTQRLDRMARDFRFADFVSIATGLLGAALTVIIGLIMRRAALTARRQQWVQTTQLGLGEHVAGELSIEQVAQRTLQALTNSLGAVAGTLYVEKDDSFDLAAVQGVPDKSAIAARLGKSDSLFSHVLQDHRPIAVGEVPEGYMAFGSGLGQARPRYLALAPAIVDGEVAGLVELGFLNPIPEQVLTLLENASATVAVAIRSAAYRTRLRELVLEMQQQSETLQLQGEELRVSNEELEEQGRALKESAARLEVQQVELEQTNSQLEEQAEELERQRNHLEKANADIQAKAREVEQASRYKSDFLANMSHELRTPLNSSLILSKLLADNPDDNLTPEQVKFAQTIHSAGNDLLDLINDILDLSKIEAGHVEINPEPVSVPRMVDGVRRLFDPLAKDKGLDFVVDVADDVPAEIQTDPQRVEQVLKNLLSNAIKFTQGGRVTLKVRQTEDDRIALAVTDTGIGIPDDQQRRIFEAFHQADSTISRRFGGTGLGLSISRELVRLLGGTLQLTSRPGQGSTFTVTIPAAFDPEAVKPALAAMTEPAAPVQERPAEEPSVPAQPRVATPQIVQDDRQAAADQVRTLLIIEDDPAFATILRDLARELEFRTIVANTAQDALDLARQQMPSAIVLDVGLPDQSGLSVLDRLKRDVRTRHIPIHIVSGEDAADRAMSLGAIGYAMKPVLRDELIAVLQSLDAKVSQATRRVLIVEDNAVQRDAVAALIASHDVETVGAATGAECLALLKEQTFDCMVLDLSLPDSSGLALLDTISRDDSHSFPPVIVYTGRVLSAEEEQELRRYSRSIIIKGAKSPERLLDEVTLFLHQVVSDLPDEQQKMIRKAHNRDALLEGRRILVVEDDVRNIYALTNILEPRGAVVEIARNGEEAIEKLRRAGSGPDTAIDLVLMDVMMPVMDGLTATRQIRATGDWKKLPIIMLTAKAMPDDQRRCIEAGANDYMAKPLDVDKLLSLVRVWMPR